MFVINGVSQNNYYSLDFSGLSFEICLYHKNPSPFLFYCYFPLYCFSFHFSEVLFFRFPLV